jgi:hypothetical protein
LLPFFLRLLANANDDEWHSLAAQLLISPQLCASSSDMLMAWYRSALLDDAVRYLADSKTARMSSLPVFKEIISAPVRPER